MGPHTHHTTTPTQPRTETQPRETHISAKALTTLPFRLCHPPPPVAKTSRTYGVAPALQVCLDDVLERRHLPPLGLKDFEVRMLISEHHTTTKTPPSQEWLLYCEDSVENLYFILWLKEYTIKHANWTAVRTDMERGASDYHHWPLLSSSHLALFYARAKQTFFTPNGAYELQLPSALLAPFHGVSAPAHPDPALFAPLAVEIRRHLDASLGRFVRAACSNVGSRRARCGIVAGCTFTTLLGAAPLACALATGAPRWVRLSAFPGLFVGLAVLLASLHGVCVGVYVFGDLRQLRAFELTRPAISRPCAIEGPRVQPPVQAHVRSVSVGTYASSSLSSLSDGSDDTAIHISPAYIDLDPVEGPATSPLETEHVPSKPSDPLTTTTASFIHPFDEYPADDPQFGGPPRISAQDRQHLAAFDFDALPGAKALIGRMQAKCSPSRVSAVPAFAVPLTPVLSSVIVRGQWEIVVRSGLIAFVLAMIICGGLVAI
ncbi:unnamed protein product [Mycena citricolor]|uniref:Uncharacterized protein n=1 Tax=Mycena citricolor TaxID=2018698 RepID=A0AAD2H5D0_9AGAR|nr:unnamed protein product [Mycena citricolor]